LRRRYHDGTSQLLFEPTTFIERLAALVPRPHVSAPVAATGASVSCAAELHADVAIGAGVY
jgi:hypothetical protein